YFRIRAKNSSGTSDWSNVADATTPAAPIAKPAKPTNLSATATSSSQINLAWADASNNEEGFDLERSTDGSSWGNAEGLGSNVATKEVTGLNASTKYYFRIRAKNSSGTSDWSNVADATTPATTGALLAPTQLRQKTDRMVVNQIQLEWNDHASNETGYEVSRSARNNSTWIVLKADLSPNTETYADAPVRPGFTYYYRVRAFRNGTFSDYSNILEVDAPVVSSTQPTQNGSPEIYPNPFTETLHLQLKQSGPATMHLSDMKGNVIQKAAFDSQISIDARGIPSGAYILKVGVGNKLNSYKIVKIQ
ncbi:fibronectin type III domain-containing protein, partial [Dyadobacter sp. CY323]|uniref:fibronectin type III domain-containing protein n=1 Tax=Dyadobacter sp. CY323 TaxID=2907302 RepID=UPI001F4666B6